MKKILPLILLALLLVGCTRTATEPEPAEPPAPPTEPLTLEQLTVEISKNDLESGELMRVARELPERLQAALARRGVQVERVTVSVGSSPAATAQALAAGGVDLAFLPAEDFASEMERGIPILASGALCPDRGEEAAPWNGAPETDTTLPGSRTLLCAGPSAYGKNLAAKKTAISWTELENARWGVLEASSLAGYRALELYLSDRYEGSGIEDLPHLTVYESWEALVRAAAREEIDLFPLQADRRTDWAEAWEREPTRTDRQGAGGMGRGDSIWEETAVLGVTERLFEEVAAVSPRGEEDPLRTADFARALCAALEELCAGDESLRTVFGSAPYTAVTEADLAPQYRLAFLEK